MGLPTQRSTGTPTRSDLCRLLDGVWVPVHSLLSSIEHQKPFHL